MNIFSKITARTMARNRTRTAVTIIGVILSTAMITAVVSFGTSFMQAMLDYSISREGNWQLRAMSIDGEKAEELKNSEEVEQIGVVTELGYALHKPVQENSPEMPYLFVQSFSAEAQEMLPVELMNGRMPENSGEVVIPYFLAGNEDEEQITKIGDILTLELGERTCQGEHLNQSNPYISMEESGQEETFLPQMTRTFQVVGIYRTWPGISYGGAGYDLLAGPVSEEELGKMPGTVWLDVYVTMKHPRNVYRFAREHLDGGYIINEGQLRWMGVADNDNFYRVLNGLMSVLLLVIVTGSVSLIYNAFSISLRERTAQFGLLASVGATKKQLRSSMRFEALVVSGVGIPLGIAAGVGGTAITLHYIGKAIMKWILGSDMGIELKVSGWALLMAAVLGLLTVLVSVWIPSQRIRKISPLEAIRSNTDIKIRPGDVKSGRWIGMIFGLEGMMAKKNYKRDRKKYRATVVSLTMSMVLFMAAALFNIYLVRTGAFVLDAPEVDLQYTAYQSETVSQEDLERVGDIFNDISDIEKVFPYSKGYYEIKLPVAAMDSQLREVYESNGLKPEDILGLQLKLIVLPDTVFSSFARGQGADPNDYGNTEMLRLMYLNEMAKYNPQTKRYEKMHLLGKTPEQAMDFGFLEYSGNECVYQKAGQVWLGDDVTALPQEIETESGFDGMIALIPDSMEKQFSDQISEDRLSACFNIQCGNASRAAEEIEERIKQAGLEDMGYLQNLTEEYETDRNTMMAIKVLTYGFITLISLIAVANVFNTISTNLLLRRREFAMLRSMGMSPKGMRRMLNYECLIYGLRAVFYGIILSLLLSVVIRRIIGIGADVSFLIPWNYLAAAVIGVFLIVFLSMLYTMRRIKKNNIVEELKASF